MPGESADPRPAAGDGMQSGGEPRLRRTMTAYHVAFYGLGGMLGAGIYGLVGEAAGQMGSAVWLAFLVSMTAALLTGLSYASIGSRYPRAAGAAYVTQRAYGRPLLTYVVGLAVVCSGLTSIATQSRVVGSNLQRLGVLENVPVTVLAIGFLLLLAAVVFRGIRESMWLNIVCTVIEISGLALIIVVGLPYWGSADLLEIPPAAEGGPEALGPVFVMQAAVLTFFSFIGFEDILNIGEEVKNPRRNIPLGLILAMVSATLIYVAVAVTAVSVVPWRELAAVPGPLAEVARRAAPWFPEIMFVAITIFAVANTALLNYVMGSRLAYGMARQGLLPQALGRVHPDRRTPHLAIAVILLLVIVLAMLGDIAQLASATVLLLMTVFVIVNSALVILKLRHGEPRGGFEVPIAVPILGALVCLTLLVNRVLGGDWRAPAMAGALLAAIALLYALLRPSHVADDDPLLDEAGESTGAPAE